MKVIKIKLEYGCFPVWIYGDNNELLENDLPSYLIGDIDIDPIFSHIQEIYDSLYINDGKEFQYIGFKESEEREKFLEELFDAMHHLRNKINDEYKIDENLDELRNSIL